MTSIMEGQLKLTPFILVSVHFRIFNYQRSPLSEFLSRIIFHVNYFPGIIINCHCPHETKIPSLRQTRQDDTSNKFELIINTGYLTAK